MKVVFLINYNDIGGAEYVSLYHIKAAKEEGFDITVLSGEKGNFYSAIAKLGVRIIHSPELNGTDIKRIKSILSEHLSNADVLMNENWFEITRYIPEYKKFGFKYCTIVHSNTEWIMNQLAPFDGITDRYYVIHQRIKDDLNRNMLGIGKTFVIPNCIDTSLIAARSEIINLQLRRKYGIPLDDLVIGMVTRFDEDKNILDAVHLVKLMNSFMPASLVIIGDYHPDRREYKKLVIRLVNALEYKDKFFLLGKMTSKQVYKHLNIFDVGLNTSPSEGLPISLLEMMCAGIYCIFPGVGDILSELKGRGAVIPIRQRVKRSEIFSIHCYTAKEKSLFLNHIINLERSKIKQIGAGARDYILKNRDISIQRKLFIKFLTFDN